MKAKNSPKTCSGMSPISLTRSCSASCSAVSVSITRCRERHGNYRVQNKLLVLDGQLVVERLRTLGAVNLRLGGQHSVRQQKESGHTSSAVPWVISSYAQMVSRRGLEEMPPDAQEDPSASAGRRCQAAAHPAMSSFSKTSGQSWVMSRAWETMSLRPRTVPYGRRHGSFLSSSTAAGSLEKRYKKSTLQ